MNRGSFHVSPNSQFKRHDVLGIESEESYGLDLNNNGDVVGYSIAYLSYKNNIYNQVHAVKWVNGEITDLHNQVPKKAFTQATAINDLGDVIVCDSLIHNNGKTINRFYYEESKKSNEKYFLSSKYGGVVMDREMTNINGIHVLDIVNNKLSNDYNSIWMKCEKLVRINDNEEIIALGLTIFGERHAMLLSPVKK